MTFSLIIAEVAVANLIHNSLSDDPPDFKVASRYLKVFYLLVTFRPCNCLHSYHNFLNLPLFCSFLGLFPFHELLKILLIGVLAIAVLYCFLLLNRYHQQI